MKRHLRTDPIVEDDDAIADALETVSVPALIGAVALLTGDPSYLRGPIRPHRWVHNEFQGALSEDEKTQLRRDGLKAICAWRDAGCPSPPPPDGQLVREVLDWIACETVADEYVPLYVEELDLAGDNPRAIDLTATAADASDVSVLVIGCGESGLLAGVRLKEAGITFEIVDKNHGVGGTWLENSYPGCRVDVASHYYSYSFEPNDDFSDYYARQPELQSYLERVLAEHDLGPHVTWQREVVRAIWSDGIARWTITLRGPDGTEETRTAHAIISAVGLLSRPSVPDIPHIDRFDGPVFHSARWDHTVDVRGKRVALIGAGASGFQIGPAIVDDVEALVVFQRTPQWMAPNPRYHASVTPGERWLMRHLPGYARLYRFMLMWQSNDKMLELVRIQEDWPDFPRTANATSAARREYFADWIDQQVGDDPVLAAKVTPTYPPMAKRMLQDNGSWLRCLKRQHVDLITERIVDVDRGAVMTAGDRYPIDVIVLATGFRPNEVLFPMQIIGRDGVDLRHYWEGKPAAYNGISVPGFPNFFMMSGPGTGLAHAGSIFTISEFAMRYIGDALKTLVENGHRSIEPTVEAHDRYRDELQREVGTLMWGHPSIEHSWYKAPDGNVYILCPWRLVDYWHMTASARAEDHHVT